MSATMKNINMDASQTEAGSFVIRRTFAATGLTPNAANTVPFPERLPIVPLRVFLTPVGNGAGARLSHSTPRKAQRTPQILSRVANLALTKTTSMSISGMRPSFK